MQSMRGIRTPKIENWALALGLLAGLTALNIWPDLIGHGSAFFASEKILEPAANGRTLFLIGQGITAVLFALFPRKFASARTWAGIPVTVLALVATASYAMAPNLGSAASLVAAVLGAMLVGACYGWYLIHLLCLLAECGAMSTIVLVCSCSLFIKTTLDLVLGSLAGMSQIVACFIMPVVTLGSTILAEHAPAHNGAPLDLAELPKCDEDNGRVLFCILIADAVLHAVTRSMSTLGFWGQDYAIGGPVTLSLAAVLVLLVLLTYLTMSSENSPDMLHRFIPAFLTLLAGFFFLDPQVASLFSIPTIVEDTLTTTIELFAHTLYWVIIVTAVRSLTSHPYRLVGLAISVLCATATVLSLIFLQTDSLQQLSRMNSVVVMFAMYGFMALLVVLFRGPQNKDTTTTKEHASGREILEQIAQEKGLTPRETEVFILLAQGRDRTFIKDELFISDATVKTHTRRIYTKLGVHSKQELISLTQHAVSKTGTGV